MKKYRIISYMRVMACILVMRGHYLDVFDVPDFLRTGIITGAGPVVLFFVISGFLAYDTLVRFEDNIKGYYLNRLKRLVPPYFIILIVAIIFKVYSQGISVLSWKWFRYFLFINMLVPSRDFWQWSNLYGYWTMGCFPCFYLIAPFIYKKMKNLCSTLVLLIGSVGTMFICKIFIPIIGDKIGGFDSLNEYATLHPLCILYLFVLGMFVAYGYRHGYVEAVTCTLGFFLLGMLALGKSGYVLWGIASACVLLKPDYSFGEWKIFRWLIDFLDRNSFNVYLLHMLVYEVWIYFVKSNNLMDCLGCVILTFLMSELLSRFISKLLYKCKGKPRHCRQEV